MAVEGLVTIESRYGHNETVERIKSELASHALELFAEIDHAKNAELAALSLRPSTVLVFGNAKAGTPLMQANQAVGLELPLKAFVWEDAGGKIWISYNDPSWIALRYGLEGDCIQIVERMSAGLRDILRRAAEG